MIQNRSQNLRPKPVAVLLVVTLLTGSAVVRLSHHAPDIVSMAANAANANPTSLEDPIIPISTAQQKIQREAERLADFALTLQRRQDEIIRREFEIARKETLLKVAKSEVIEKINELKATEDNLRATIALSDTAAETDLERLTAVYENMKPKEAAGLFEEMAPDFAAGFLSRMRPDSAAAILTGLRPDTAYTISVIMAGRNAELSMD